MSRPRSPFLDFKKKITLSTFSIDNRREITSREWEKLIAMV